MTATCFNPGLGFRSVATLRARLADSANSPVSIPVWVFGPSRPLARRSAQLAGVSIPVWVFGPSRRLRVEWILVDRHVSIPVWVFGPSRHSRRPKARRDRREFQSRSGFSVRRDRLAISPKSALHSFQSRSGFSVRRDPPECESSQNSSSSFNPGLGFRSVATIWRSVHDTATT